MATMILSAVGTAIGGPIGGAIGGFIGSAIDSYAINSLLAPTFKQEGPRLDGLQVQASTEGAPLPEIAGGVRIAGQIIWATNFKEVATTEKQGGKGSAGKVETTNYSYYANFAVALCEGVIDRIGRVWADGKPLDLTGVTMRVYRGTSDQEPDPFIEGVEGVGKTPAYRNTAYVMFENFLTDPHGRRIPQLTFEVFRKVGAQAGAEDLITAVNMIPGAGERAYDTVIYKRDGGLGKIIPENQNSGRPEADWTVAVDDLQASLPNVNAAFLVVGWFGDDLRADHCGVAPRADTNDKRTIPGYWAVQGLDRTQVPIVSQIDGRPAYGGTPADDSVVRAIRDAKARGLSVILYPFLFMDIPSGNSLPNPYGGSSQPAYPWRGRITCNPAIGQSGTVNKTATAATQVNAFFGSAAASNIAISVNPADSSVAASYSGPSEWSYRRFILHYAKLVAAINAVDPGAVDGMLIGSELRGITQVRSSASAFPAVTALKTLAADVKAVVGPFVKVGYAGDWSEYNGYNPGDGSGDFFFHLDPLWSDANIDFVGVDNYVPLSDWRDGTDHLDAAAGAASVYDPDYLQSNVEGGEYYDWYYASSSDRDNQVRTPITDGAYGKPWVYRAKDFRNWWLNAHYNRPGGVESATPTGWTPQSKPIWFTEFGVPSIDRGTNQPNVFYDPKSSESVFPYYSRGNRDDLIQRRGLEAQLGYWATPGNNPVSTVYAGPMIEKISVWTWDARPFPAWPSRTDVWSDGALWPLGHWIKGKIGFGDLAALVTERCARVGFSDVDVTSLAGTVNGYLRDRPLSPRGEIESLMQAFAFDAVESGDVIRFVSRGAAPVLDLTVDDLVAAKDDEEPFSLTHNDDVALPDTVNVAFVDVNKEYQSGAVSRSRLAGYSERVVSIRLPLVIDSTQGQTIADRTLAEAWLARDVGKFALPPSMLAIEPTDVVRLEVNSNFRAFRIGRVTDSGPRAVEVERNEQAIYGPVLPGVAPPTVNVPKVYGPAELRFIDLPMLSDSDIPYAPYLAAAGDPWCGVTVMDSPTGDDYALDTSLAVAATLGVTTTDFNAGPMWRWDEGNVLTVEMSGELASATDMAVLGGANRMAIQNADGDWEVFQFGTATLVSAGVYEVSHLLRGQLGTEDAMRSPVAAGAPVVLLNGALAQMSTSLSERDVPRYYSWGPSRLAIDDASWQQTTFTFQSVGLKPWAPVSIEGARDGSGNLAISWIRRTRLGGDSWTAGDVPLSEESEAYEVDILNGASVARTLASSTPSVTYTAADQTADFGAPQSSVDVVVYQLSATVNRGHPGAATL